MLQHILMLLLLTVSCGVSCLEATDLKIVKSNYTSRLQEFTNLEVHNNTFYVGANNSVLFYSDNLTFMGAISTCGTSSESCNNLNKVLVVNKEDQQLIFCGTARNGTCENRNLTSLNKTYITSNYSEDLSRYLQVSSDTNRPAEALVTMDGVLIIAVTYGKGFEKPRVDDRSYNYPISFRTLDFIKITPRDQTVHESYISLNISGLDDYIVYYRGLFHVNNSSYFITNQKEYVGGSKNISKLAQVNCFNTKTYADIEISCISEDKTYDLVQDVVLIPSASGKETYTVFVFSGGKDSEDPEDNSALCVKKLSVLDNEFLDAKVNFTNFCNETLEIQKLEKRYLANKKFQRSGYTCTPGWNSTYLTGCKSSDNAIYTIGDRPLTMNASKVFSSRVITLHTARHYEDSVLLAGTFDGTFFMMNFEEGNIKEYHRQTVSSDPVRALYMDDDAKYLYVMTSKELQKLELSQCREYSSCSAVLEGRNPLCGWCLFQSSSTRREHCEGEAQLWIPTLREKCPSLTSNQTKMEITKLKNKINITVVGVALWNYNSYNYECFFQSVNKTSIARFVSDSGNQLECSLPNITKHMDETLWLRVKNGSNIASLKLLFFSCDFYRKCWECIEDCKWCRVSAKCISRRSDAPNCTMIDSASQCPHLSNSSNVIPSSEPSDVSFTAKNLQTELNYTCRVLNTEIKVNKSFVAVVDGETITCNLNVTAAGNGTLNYRIIIEYSQSGAQGNSAVLDDEHSTTVTVYDCKELGKDCSLCEAFGEYKCRWNTGSNICEYKQQEIKEMECPLPEITKIVPDSATHVGDINVELEGKNFGFKIDQIKVNLCNESCAVNKTDSEFCKLPEILPLAKKDLICKIVCKAGNLNKLGSLKKDNDCVIKPGKVSISRNGGQFHIANVSFYYKMPIITNIDPSRGPEAGGTVVTLSGNNLGVGNLKYFVNLNSDSCGEPKVVCPEVIHNCLAVQDYETRMNINYSIVCTTPPGSAGRNVTSVRLVQMPADNPIDTYQLQSPFTYLQNPEIFTKSLEDVKGIVSGGNRIEVTGKYLRNAQRARVKGTYEEKELISTCYFEDNIDQETQRVTCPVPTAPKALKSAIEDNASRRRKRAADCDSSGTCVEVKVQVFFDGVFKNFTIKYFRDPTIYSLNGTKLFSAEIRELTILGQNINLGSTEADVKVTIGQSECTSLKLEMDSLTCLVPEKEPEKTKSDSHRHEVNVKIGNLDFNVGSIEYKKELDLIITIAGAGGGGALAIVVIVLVIALYKCRKIQKKANEYQKELAEIEMNIVKVVREEFLDMHTTMSTVNRNLVEQGFPYHSYQQYACNVMFSVDYLWTEPVVSTGEMTDDERIRANRGMEQFESLIYNKFFLFSVISTLEKEKRFFIKEKSNFAGNLCAVLMGKMEYLEEIMKMLLSNHVQETPSKKQKTLFRRCESITEKLLSNWLSLCLYPHIKAHSSSPLYLLYVAIQKTMESGPIDAVTHDAKYTLCEEKLLKKWSSTAEESGSQDIKFEAKTLTLNLVVDNGEEIFKCKVLDCDTISQVKSKCMAQIYVNFPASQLSVHPDELALEWHEGFGGALKLRDEDNTSKQDGHWLRLNTLAHYNVKDDSNMALVDPTCDGVKEEDYVNLTHVNIDVGSNGSFDSSEPLAPKDEENPNPLERWHLVKKEEETSKQGKSAIAELYLNRLLTTKQCVIEYVRTLWDTILDKNRCPPPVRFLFEYLDELGERGKVDPDTLHAWKSHSYAIRVWGSLMKMPALLFDIEIPGYMDDSLEVISQVFIESFSPDTQKVTKDSASWKLIFNNEVISLRDKVKDFYKNVKVDSQTPEEYRQYMEEVKRYQQETKFNKVSALYRLYKQIKPFIDDIVEDLSESQASSLQLDKKLEKVMEIMEAEEE